MARSDGRWYALFALTAGLFHLVFADAAARPDTSGAFVDRWALTLWAGIGCLVVLARGLWKASEAEAHARGVVTALWTAAGILLFG